MSFHALIGRYFALALLAVLPAGTLLGADPATALRIYIGTYTGSSGSQGIYQAELNVADGALKLVGLAGEAKNPSFIALPPSAKFLYAVSEVDDYDDSRGGALSAFAVDAATGNLELLNHQSSGGAGPCFVSLDKSGKHALVANYGGGSVAVLPIDAAGKLQPASCFIQQEGSGPDKSRQEGPHAHCIKLDAANRFALACDLGADKVFIYRFDPASGKLTVADQPWMETEPAAGPRHLAFHPSGKWVYVVNELNSTLTAAAYDGEAGTLKRLQSLSTIPAGGVPGNSGAEVVAHPNGKFVYSSNRGDNSIAMFAIDRQTGKLTSLGQHPVGGKTPRNFNIDPSGKFLLAAAQDSDRIVVHAIDQATGKLTQTEHSIDVPMPVCIKFAP
ncbi:lactonase family protein [Lacipirellula limnantheis]|uniref:6-phosphogluconolactonase n=1 Tax=Lacipirellula limnantheis TaxID=2528024 RepID=A0A517U0P9_9BACT|nr:lactonase family protein [Lacipirellula limnantheis]QDT74185.1 6-phosphogluconolactonase [Lacipirellula limnantheis]